MIIIEIVARIININYILDAHYSYYFNFLLYFFYALILRTFAFVDRNENKNPVVMIVVRDREAMGS